MARLGFYDLKRLMDEYPKVPTVELAKKYGVSTSYIRSTASQFGIKKDFEERRQYRDARDPKKRKEAKRREIRERLIADFPYYSNKQLSLMYGKTVQQIIDFGKRHWLKKDTEKLHKNRVEWNREIIADYGTRPTAELAAELGISVEALHKRAQRAGIRKDEDFKPVRPKQGERNNTKLIKAFARTSSVEDIASGLGLGERYVKSVIRKAGMNPISKRPGKVVIQWSMDGKMIAKYESAAQAARAVGKKHYSNIYLCYKGKKKSAYGYRWTLEDIQSVQSV